MSEVFVLYARNAPVAAGTRPYQGKSLGCLVFMLSMGLTPTFLFFMWATLTELMGIHQHINTGISLSDLLSKVIPNLLFMVLYWYFPFKILEIAIRAIDKERHLKAGGCLLSGEVIGLRKKSMRGSDYFCVSYRFLSPEGQILEGVADMDTITTKDPPPLGTPLAIWYSSPQYHTAL
jgi:hypothetical protein